MKVIIAGGRDYQFIQADINVLNAIDITEVVSGGARGADAHGELYAEFNGIKLTIFPADWDKYKKAAGHIRNRQMAEYADAVVLFPGGRGTDNMFKVATQLGLLIYDMR